MSTATRSVEVPAPVRDKLDQVRRRDTRLQFLAGTIAALAAFLLVMMGAMLFDWFFTLFDTSTRVVLTIGAVITGVLLLAAWGLRPLLTRYRMADVARDVDAAVPDLEERWSTVTELADSSDPPEKRGAAAMIEQVTHEARSLETLVTPEAVATTEGVRRNLYLFGGVSAALILAVLIDWQQTSVLLRRFWQPTANISLTQVESITGDAVVAEGEQLNLKAKVENGTEDSALLFVRDSNSRDQQPITLFPVLGEGEEYDYKLASVKESFEYRIRSGDGQTPWHQITVAKRPKLSAVEFRISPPKYSKQPVIDEKGLPRRVRALEGSRLQVAFRANVELDQLLLKLGNETERQLRPTKEGRYEFQTTLTEMLILSPILTSRDGLTNERPPVCRITVYRDRAPTVKIAAPNDEIAVRPDDEVTVEFIAKDDFGIKKAELVVFSGHGDDARELESIEIPLGDQQGAEKIQGETKLDLKKLDLKQGTELSYAVRVFDTKNATASTELGESDSPSRSPEGSPAPDQLQKQQRATASANSKPGEPNDAQLDKSKADELKKLARHFEQSPQSEADENQQDQQASANNNSSPNSQAGFPGKKQNTKKSNGEMAGAPKPDDDMTRRAVDVGQCTTCKPMRLTIDEWAGSFAGQAREKLQLEIDPILKELDRALAAAEETVTPLVKSVEQSWSKTDREETERTDRHLAVSEEVIVQLRGKTAGTPYAFMGLQLVEIGHSHVEPARKNIKSAAAEDAARRPENLKEGLHHIRRARELLAKLTWQYELVKVNEKLAEEMVRVKKMHQVFIEGTFALLKSQKPTLNPKSRKFIEYDIDEEFRKKLTELLEKKRDIQAQLAKALGKDPRLLNRFMARTRLQADSLRDQLTILARRHEKLSTEVAAWKEADGDERKRLATGHIRARQLQTAAEISSATALLLDNYLTWTPLDLDPSQGELGKLHEAGTALATTARDFTDAVVGEEKGALQHVEMLHRQLKEFAARLPDVMQDHPEHDRLAVHVANRLTETNKLITQTSGWIYQSQNLADGNFHITAEVEQHRIATDTAELTRKLENLKSWLAGMPKEIQDSGEILFLTLNEELIPDLESAQTTLQQNQLKRTVEFQSDAMKSFAKAEEQCDDLMDRIIKELDSKPVDTKLRWTGPVETKSLDDFLAMLEDEAKAVEGLGIPCCRPSNLIIEKDWMMPGSNPGSSGSGGGQLAAALAQGQTATKQAGRMQRAMLRKIRDITKRGDETLEKTGANRREDIRWNTLASQLKDQIRQGRGHIPPEQYRRAIERYFELIAAEPEASPTAE